jgi:hypothetical protein
VDYEGLTGGVTIPAGRRSARIEIIPRDDNLVEGLESVVIAVEPPPVLIPFWIGPITLPEPSYLPGFPNRAAAVLQDNDRPRPPCLRLSDGQFHACLPATNGFCYRLEVSTNCVHWLPVCTNVVTEGALHFVDPDGPECQIRFYRAVPEPNWRPED